MVWLGRFLSLGAVILAVPIIAVTFVMYFVFTSVSGSVAGISGESLNNAESYKPFNLNDLVLAYKPLIEKYAMEEGIVEYVPFLLAIMMQESGGRGNDPMQVSEAHCGSIGCITNIEDSIKYGVKRFKELLELADGDVEVALQAYNYGTNFINWIKNRGGKYTLELATEYSIYMYEQEKKKGRGKMYKCNIGESKTLGSCYGDYLYVPHVMRYVSVDSELELGTGVWKSPLDIPLVVTSPYGWRVHPINGNQSFHNGIDFSCNQQNIPIRSVDDGVVVQVTNQRGYGNVVMVQHEKKLYSFYAHLHTINVRTGDKVSNRTKLGTCGTTGNSTGIHLHLEARTSPHGGQIDPMGLLGN